MALAEVVALERCWTTHHQGRVELRLDLAGKAVAVPLDLGKIEDLRQKLTEAEMLLINQYNERGR